MNAFLAIGVALLIAGMCAGTYFVGRRTGRAAEQDEVNFWKMLSDVEAKRIRKLKEQLEEKF